jgi:hypothetical protein
MASVELGFACLPGKRVACWYSRANPACGRQPSSKAAGFARLGYHALSIEMGLDFSVSYHLSGG